MGDECNKLAIYIIKWLETRNRSELASAFDAQKVSDRRLMIEELTHILAHGGHPPNWTK